jgi:hypothetical protein
MDDSQWMPSDGNSQHANGQVKQTNQVLRNKIFNPYVWWKPYPQEFIVLGISKKYKLYVLIIRFVVLY